MSARERILGRVREAASAPGDRAAAVRARLGSAGRQTAPVPALAASVDEARAAQFEAKLAAVDGTLTRLPSMEALPAALAEALRARNLARAIRIGEEPDFAGLDWAGTEVTRGPGRLEEPATLSRAFRGVAETGTLALRSGPDNPVTLTFLGETHFVVLRRSELLGGLEELFAAARGAGATPRTLNLVTGPSRSADIGATLQLGAHGPKALHVFLIED
ncbi:MAG: LUD domain-containing protein [Paracoccaceae bacterium]